MPDEYHTLRVQREGPLLSARIHRAEAENSLDAQLTAELLDLLQRAGSDPTLKVLALSGQPTVFCSGMDFEGLTCTLEQGGAPEDDQGAYWEVLHRLSRSPLVTVAMVRGKVTAGGVGVVAACDLVMADDSATFALPELLFGLLPACVLPFLIRRVGFQRARLLALTTKAIDAREAHRWGLVDEIGDDPERALKRLATRLGCLEDEAIGRLKRYTEDLWIIRDQTRDLAVGTITDLVNDREIQGRIRRFVREGVYPWQNR